MVPIRPDQEAPVSDFPAESRGPGGAASFTPRGEESPAASDNPAPAAAHAPAQAPAAAPAPAPAPASGPPRLAAMVRGRIEVADEVVEKVAGLAALEVEGVADVGGDIERALESVRERIGIGQKRGDQGIKAEISGNEVAISVTIMIEYGHVVMDVARRVQTNVAIQTNRMLGLNVVEVNINVDDVRMPRPAKAGQQDGQLSEPAPADVR